MSEALAHWGVEIDAGGVVALKKQLEGVFDQVKVTAAATKVAGDAAIEMAKKSVGAWQSVATAAKWAGAGILGFVTAGLQGTAENERLLFSLRMISREIANIFTPAIHAVMGVLENVLARFQALTGGQQAFLRNIVAATGGALIFATAFGSLIPKLTAVAETVNLLWAGLAAHPLIAVAAAIGALVAGTEEGRAAFDELFTAVKPIFEVFAELGKLLASVLAPIIQGIGEVFKSLVDILNDSGILEWISNFLKMVAQGLAAIRVFIFGASRQRESANQGRQNLSQRSEGFESFEQTWRTLQQAAMKTDIQQRQLDAQLVANGFLATIAGSTSNPASNRPNIWGRPNAIGF